MLLVVGAVILALFVFYRSTSPDPPPVSGGLKGADRYTARIRNWESADYRVLAVAKEDLGLRVSLTAGEMPVGSAQVRVKTMNALYEMQALVGKEISISVWLYGSDVVQRPDLLGMAFYRVLTEKTIFRKPEEIP